jgi:hypothetical protein
MELRSTSDEQFRCPIENWLADGPEVAVLIQFSAAGGAKLFEFINSMPAFLARLSKLPPRTCVTVFRRRQLPLRGAVDDRFISAVLAEIPEGAEYLIAGLETKSLGKCSWTDFIAGESLTELRTDLADLWGEAVAVGLYPGWEGVVGHDFVWAIVPEPDGSVVDGVY